MDLDNIFKDKLYGYSEDPPSHIWEGIKQTRTPFHIWLNKVKLNAWNYAAILTVVLFIVGIAYFQMQNAEPKLTNNTNTDSDVEKSKESSSVKKEDHLNTDMAIESGSSVVDPIIHSESSGISSQRNIVSTSQPEVSKEFQNRGVRGDEIRTPVRREGFAIPTDQNNVGQGLVNQKIPKDRIEEIPKENREMMFVVPKKDIVEFQIESNTFESELIPNPPSPEPTIKPKKGYSVELAYGALNAFRTLNGNESTTKKWRSQSEEQKFSYQLGLKLNKEFNIHWEFQTGLNFLVRNEQVDHTRWFTKNEMGVKNTTVWIQRPNDLPIQKVISDTTYINRKYSDVTNRINTYRYLSIPVAVRYNHYFSKFGIFVTTGVMFDVNRSNNAFVLNKSEILEATSNNAMTSYFHSRGLLSLGSFYRFNSTFSLSLESVGTYSINNLSSKSYGLKQREYTYGLQTSLRYNF